MYRRTVDRMDNKGRRARVAYAMIDFAEGKLTPKDWGVALRESLKNGTWTERYGRRWYMAKWTEDESKRWITGRLAFEYVDEEPSVWDEAENDVRTLDTLSAGKRVQVVPFVIDTTARRAAFELRAQTVRPGTFQGNLQALLVKASAHPWRVELEGVKQQSWDEWQERADRITAIWITVRPPNPHNPLPSLIELFEAGVSSATVQARGEDIKVAESELLNGSVGNALDYGSLSSDALVTEGGKVHKEHWQLAEEGGVRKDETHRDETGHVPTSELRRLLQERAKEATDGEQSAEA